MKHPATLLGMAVGDSLGMPFETLPADHPDLLSWTGEFRGNAYHRLEPGQYTDDTQMALALAGSLHTMTGVYDQAGAAKAYLAWYQHLPRGIGGTIRRAMQRLDKGVAPADSGRYEAAETHVGNGVSMRIAPLGVVYPKPSQLWDLARAVKADAAITHNHHDAVAAALAVAVAVGFAVTTQHRGVVAFAHHALTHVAATYPAPRVLDRLDVMLRELPRKTHPRAFLGGDDAVGISTLALYIVDVTETFEEAILCAVRLGGDTDTRAAIVGAIVGAMDGVEGIPAAWCAGVENYVELCDADHFLNKTLLRVYYGER